MLQGKVNAIIAGSSGLVGDELIHQLLAHPHFQTIYSLSRSELPFRSKKLIQIVHPELRVTAWDETDPTPTVGFICLGTTKKQAGSSQALKAVDFQLVKDVATTMHLLGVKHIVVISSLFANPCSPSHYLRCKGRMEKAIKAMGFDHCIFVRPGPLKGERSKPRKDELLVQGMFHIFRPLVIGPLAHLNPIPAEDVARSMLELSLLAENNHAQSVKVVSGKALQSDSPHP